MHPLEAAVRMIANGGPPEIVERTDVEGKIAGVSTIDTEEGYGYETALFSRIDDSWHPVERYETRDEAVTGHTRWVEKVPTLERIVDIGLPIEGFDAKTVIEL